MKSMTAIPGIQLQWSALFAGLFCLSLAAVASAEAGGKPCADDAAKLCKDVPKGEGRMAQCLRDHKDELSPACKENIGKMKAKARNLKEACKEDAEKLCKGIEHGGGKVRDCLKQHEGELSPACKEGMNQPRGRR